MNKQEEDFYVNMSEHNERRLGTYSPYWICDNPQEDIQELINKEMGDMYE